MTNTDPRGPSRTITSVHESPTGGPTHVTLSCGHRVERANHFAYRIGDADRCLTCRDLAPYVRNAASGLAEHDEAVTPVAVRDVAARHASFLASSPDDTRDRDAYLAVVALSDDAIAALVRR